MGARLLCVRGIVQGVGFRPFVFRLAHTLELRGWVLNQEDGVRIHIEGPSLALEHFVEALRSDAPAAANITDVDMSATGFVGFKDFVIRDSERTGAPSVRISPDLPVCDQCLTEL